MGKSISRFLDENLKYIDEKTGGDKCLDIVTRHFILGGRQAALVFIDGFAQGDLLSHVLRRLLEVEAEEVSVDFLNKIIHKHLSLVEVETIEDLDDGIIEVLSGPQLLLVENETEALILDARTWENRAPEEPELEKATRGPADGFSETLIFNLALIRRRIRDTNLRTEGLKVGRRSKTDVSLVYIEDLASEGLVDSIRSKLQKIDTDGLPLGDKTIEEFLTGRIWNPFPTIRYTERPDTVAAHILEGHICVLVDTSPTAILLPAPLLSQTQSLEEYRHGTITGTYLTFLRFLSIFLSVLLPPLWLVLTENREVLPEFLQFIGPKEETVVPLGLQFILASLGIDIIRMASLSTPNALATSLGLIGALFLGEFAVEVGLFAPETILYIATAAVSTFSIPGFELSLLLQLLRLFLLVFVVVLDWPGLLGGVVIIFVVMAVTRSFGVPYLWPLLPLHVPALMTFLGRQSILTISQHRSPLTKEPNKRRTGEGG